MKKYYYLAVTLAIGLFATSCSGGYENAISNYIKSAGSQDVKIIEVKELKKVTVGDSINYINLKAEQLLKNQVDAAGNQLANFQQDLVKLGSSSKVVADAYTVQLTRTQQKIDSLKALKPVPTTLYDGKKTEQILAIITECKYKVKDSATGEEIDIVKNFVLSADGKECYGTTENPELSIEK